MKNDKHLKSVVVDDKVVLMNINRNYHDNMSEKGILEAVCSSWVIGPRRDNAEYAFAIFRGEVVGVFTIDQWHFDGIRNNRQRWSFKGKFASNDIQNKYIGGSIARYIKHGAQNPIHYLNC